MRNIKKESETEPTSVPPPDSQSLDGEGHTRPHYHESRPLRIRRVSMGHGWYWLIEGFMLWARSIAFLSFLTLCFVLGILLASVPPVIGEMLGTVLYPGLLLGVFNGCRAIDRKRKLSPGLLFSGFRRYAFDLLLAGFCNFVVIVAVLLSTRLIDDGVLWRMCINAEIPDLTAFLSPPLLISSLYAGIVIVLWGVVYLLVPQLIGWWRLSVPKALIFSLKGCLINFLPFFAYFFCFSFFIIVLSAITINFLEFGLAAKGLGIVACFAFLFITSPALIASFYVAARDIYGFPRRRKHKRRRPNPAQDERRKQKELP
jgi:hypothetical protein